MTVQLPTAVLFNYRRAAASADLRLRARLRTGRGVFHRGGMLHRRCPLARLAVRQQFDSASWLTCRRQALSLHDQRSSLPHGIRGWQSGIPGLRVPMQRRRRGQPACSTQRLS